MFAVSGIATILFLGGWERRLPPAELARSLWIFGKLLGVVVFVLKAWGWSS